MVFKVVALIVFIGLVQGHVIPLSVVHPSLQYTIRGPAGHVVDPHHLVISHAVSPWVVPHVIAAHPPAVVEVAAAPAKVVVAEPVVVAPAHEGSYVAKTRGSEHVAPLPGHSNSVTVLNAEPAPGTV
ncbi:hypothetical protein ACFFRR_004866 [Megaselia abdita]